MSSTESQLQQIEKNIKESRKVVELGDALARLQANRDFKKVIVEGFFEQEAIRLVHLKADFNMQNEAAQKSIMVQMDAIGALASYMQTLAHRAELARKAIAFDEEVMQELAEGELQ